LLSSIIAAKEIKKQKNCGGPFKWNKKNGKTENGRPVFAEIMEGLPSAAWSRRRCSGQRMVVLSDTNSNCP
jgi:hypothetical protein